MPDPVDAFGFAWFLALFFGMPLLGYVAMVIDYRAYLRSLRRALVLVKSYRLETPLWALRERPACLEELDIDIDCTYEEVMAAYRHRAKQVHPDHGGDRQQFDRLQQCLHEALVLMKNRDSGSTSR